MSGRLIRRILAIGAVVVLAGFAGACSNDGDDDDAAVEASGGNAGNGGDDTADDKGGDDGDDDAKVSVSGGDDEGDGKIKVETDDGTFEGGPGSDLPDEFPDDFPLPDDADVQFSGSQSGDEGDAMTVIIASKEPGKDLYEFYKEELEDQGYQVTQSFSGESDGNFSGSLGFTNSDYEGVIGIGEDADAGTTSITVSLTTK